MPRRTGCEPGRWFSVVFAQCWPRSVPCPGEHWRPSEPLGSISNLPRWPLGSLRTRRSWPGRCPGDLAPTAGATGGNSVWAVAEFQNARPDLSRHHGRIPAAPNRTARPVNRCQSCPMGSHSRPGGRQPTPTGEPETISHSRIPGYSQRVGSRRRHWRPRPSLKPWCGLTSRGRIHVWSMVPVLPLADPGSDR